MAKNTKSSWKDDKKFITSWHLTLRDIWNFITCWQVDKLTSSTLWRVDMLTSYQEFRIIWFWAPKFETTTYSLTYLLTRVKSRDASASKKSGSLNINMKHIWPWKYELDIRRRVKTFRIMMIGCVHKNNLGAESLYFWTQ